ncbi:histidine triad nucleotide-binding protein [Teredinibacter franksiae]|uniref:histidine triad nucleotide-binding protein n=1 Tax=Teredinibacter franksiae TaxID=2761453 RepID=UPI0016260F68|nr:histidine triad nucleotide-binding protein [Teredinibacter franksiae]
MSEETLFTKIINGNIPAEILFEDDHCICIRDINPQAPTHVLVIPRKPLPRLVDATEDDKALLGHLMLKVGEIARELGIERAFRVVINNGESAGQTVFHLHLHILGNTTFDEGSLGIS